MTSGSPPDQGDGCHADPSEDLRAQRLPAASWPRGEKIFGRFLEGRRDESSSTNCCPFQAEITGIGAQKADRVHALRE
jgi:hypothetical protein